MVIYTPRLCSDVTFLPQRENKAHSISCREIVHSRDIEDWKVRKRAESERNSLVGAKEPVTVGGIEVGAALNVGKDGRRIDSGSRGSVDVVATSKGSAKGGKVEMLTDEELRKLDLDPETIDMLREKLQSLAGDKGWKLEVLDTEGGGREIRGVLDEDPSEAVGPSADEEHNFESEDGDDGEGEDENAENREGFQAGL
jgi:protein OS-9